MTVDILKWAEVLKNFLLLFSLENTNAMVAVKFAAVTMQLNIFNRRVKASHSSACVSDNLLLGAVAQNPLEAAEQIITSGGRCLKKSFASNCRKNLTSCFCLSTTSALSVVPKLHSCMFLTGCNSHFLILYGYFY